MKKNALLNVAIGLAIAILGVVGYKLSSLWHQNADMTLPISACNPSHEACTAILPDGNSLLFSLEPRPIKPLKPLHLIVEISGSEEYTIEVDFDGTEMNMGYNRPVLTGTKGRFSGQAILPVCISGTMNWTATLLINTQQQRIAVPFQFSVAAR